MSGMEDKCKPVIKALGNSERENHFPASQRVSEDQFHCLPSSGYVCSDNDGINSYPNRYDITADEDLGTILSAKGSSKMEEESAPCTIRKISFKAALLNAPCCDNSTDGAVNCALDTDYMCRSENTGALSCSCSSTCISDSSKVKHVQENMKEGKCASDAEKCTKSKDYADSKEQSPFAKFMKNFGDLKENGLQKSSEKEPTAADPKDDFDETSSTHKNAEEGPRKTDDELKAKSSPRNYNQNETVKKEEKGKEERKDILVNIPEDDEDTVCGIGVFRPKWLQKWATPRCYLVLYSIIGVLQGSYYAYLISTISTLEKRFAFKSKISGVIMIIDEITPLVLGIFVGYFGGKAHRPRMVAFGMFLSTLCCLFSALPFFIYGPAQHLTYRNSTGTEVCDFQQKRDECNEDDQPPTVAAVVFLILGSFLKGFGNLAYYAVGLAYMDDNAEKRNTPIYLGISFALRLLGPTSGFLMSSAFLKIYENPFVDPGFGREDPRWIGAWWMGFVLQGVLLFFFTFPIMLFPRRLPNQNKPNPCHQSSFEHEGFVQKIKGLLAGLKRLSTNEIYVYLSIESIFSVIGGFGHYMMLPKYMENQFHLSASDASLYAGPPGLVALQISTVLGSVLIWKYRMTARTLIAGRAVTETLGVILVLILMIPSCPNISFAGTSTTGKGLDLQNECNKDCLCTSNVFTPLCGPDGVSTYFSSCHAGCSTSLPKDIYGREVFGNCSCVQDENGSFVNVEKMEKGFCSDENCWTQAIIYIIILPIIDGVTSIFRVGHTLVFLRCIDPQDKSFALGTFEAMLCLFGFIPYPVIFGALADSVCLIWEFSCESTGNCWVYDMQKFNFLLHSVCAGFCFAAVFCDIRIFFLSHRIRDLYTDGDDLQAEQNKNLKKPDGKVSVSKSKESVESTHL